MSITRYKNISKIKNSDFTPPSISASIPTPTVEDYTSGYIRRYFVQKYNDKSESIYEVSSTEFKRVLTKPNYTGVSIKWRISGPINESFQYSTVDPGVRQSNRIAISLYKEQIPNLKFYLPNLLQFHK